MADSATTGMAKTIPMMKRTTSIPVDKKKSTDAAKLSMFSRLSESVCGVPETGAEPLNEALGLTNDTKSQMTTLQHLIQVGAMLPTQGRTFDTTDTVGSPGLFTGNGGSFPAPLDAIAEPMARAAKGISDMVDMFRECREGIVTKAERDMCDEYIRFFQTLLREVFKKKLCYDLSELGGV